MSTETLIRPQFFSNPFNKEAIKLSKTSRIVFFIALIATVFDSISSWYTISYSEVALEGNNIWNIIAGQIGFGGAMIVRGVWGLFLLVFLFHCASHLKQNRARNWAVKGLWIVSSSLIVLSFYHVFGFMWANSIWLFN